MLPEEFYLTGPPVAGELLLRRTIDRVRREGARAARLRFAALALTALLTLATATGLGLALGDRLRPVSAQVAFAASGNGAMLDVSVRPGTDGSRLGVTLAGMRPGLSCRLTVLGADGSTVVAGSWRTTTTSQHLDLSVYLDPARITAVELTAGDGVDLRASR